MVKQFSPQEPDHSNGPTSPLRPLLRITSEGAIADGFLRLHLQGEGLVLERKISKPPKMMDGAKKQK